MSYKFIPEIKLSSSKRSYEVWFKDSKGEDVLHKKGLTLDQANREIISVNGHTRLLNDLLKKVK